MAKLISLIILAGVLAGGFWSARTIFLQQEKIKGLEAEVARLGKDPQAVAKEEVVELTKKMAQIAVLPEGEDPIVATVTDKDKLKDQPIFARAENGDKLLIYAKARKAYLFRPTENKVVDVFPIITSGGEGEVAGAATEAPAKEK